MMGRQAVDVSCGEWHTAAVALPLHSSRAAELAAEKGAPPS